MEWTNDFMLATLLIIPLLAALLIVLQGERRARSIALVGAILTFIWSLAVMAGFEFADSSAFQHQARYDWIPAIGLSVSLGIDSIAIGLILLTTFLLPLTVLGSYTAVTSRQRQFYAWIMVLEAAMLGVFCSRDLILFYACFEFTLLPMYFLIAGFGSTNRSRASIVFFLYTFSGSVITLAGLLFVSWTHWSATSSWTFDIADLTQTARSMTAAQQGWLLLSLCCGFAVKVPLFPVHTWLPLAHTEAPTAGSVILAAVLLKLGTYGLLRFALPMTPLALAQHSDLIAALCVVGILYGALVCWVQRDMKKLIAYSSVSHLGFCVLGLVALNPAGVSGSYMYMINHGLSTGALFLCIGMIYERYHTRSMDELGGLARRMPMWAFFFVFFVLSSVGLPGLNGFIGEFLCLLGAFASGRSVSGQEAMAFGSLGPLWAAVAGVGMILAAVYLLFLTGCVAFGPYHTPHHTSDRAAHDVHRVLPLSRDLSGREICVLTPIAAVCVILGLKPGLLLDPVAQPIHRIVALANNAEEVQIDHHREHTSAENTSNGALSQLKLIPELPR